MLTSALLGCLAACADLEDTDESAVSSGLQALDEEQTGGPVGPTPLPFDGGSFPTESNDGEPRPLIDAGAPIKRDAGRPTVDAGSGPSRAPLGEWRFDDCNATTLTLVDTSPSAIHARRTGTVSCAPGVRGASVAFDDRRDLVEAPASPRFALSSAMTVGLWVFPQTRQGALISKQHGNQTAFELSIERGRAVFSIALRTGNRTRRISSNAPIALSRWSFVAGSFDGEFVRLFVDGRQVGQVFASGVVADVDGAIRIGGEPARQFNGRIDDAQLYGRALDPFEIQTLSCSAQPARVTVSPEQAGATDPDVVAEYDIAIENQNVGACSEGFFLIMSGSVPDISATVAPSERLSIASGQTGHFTVSVVGSSDAEPGPHLLPFSLFSDGPAEPLFGELNFTLNEPTGCFVRTSRELLIRDLSVVEDPVRTTFAGDEEDPRRGVWTFARLAEAFARTPSEAPALVEKMFHSWLQDQTINTFAVPARSEMARQVLDSWPRSNGALDLRRAPLRLLSIVNRLDVRNLEKGHAGEGRFVFGVLDPRGDPLEFTIILEYRLPARSSEDVVVWANAWHALGALPFPSEAYNSALQALTARFAGRDAEPGRPNGSALGQLRTNENALDPQWELREFKLSQATGMLEPSFVELTPDISLRANHRLLANYINQNEAAILSERHELPELFEETPFVAGSSFNTLAGWIVDGVDNPEARHRFSLNTCDGCHALQETGTNFLHIFPRFAGEVSELSGFMTGQNVADPMTGIPRTFNDLGRRNADLKAVVCGGTAPTVTTPLPQASARRAAVSPTAREQFLARGIGRVH